MFNVLGLGGSPDSILEYLVTFGKESNTIVILLSVEL